MKVLNESDEYVKIHIFHIMKSFRIVDLKKEYEVLKVKSSKNLLSQRKYTNNQPTTVIIT